MASLIWWRTLSSRHADARQIQCRLVHLPWLPHPVSAQLKPGLSSYAETPTEGADSLKPLLDKALSVVPSELRATTPIEVRATAGLRMLPAKQADELLEGTQSFCCSAP